MKIEKGHYVPKELITSEAIHEAVVKAFMAAGVSVISNNSNWDVRLGWSGLGVSYSNSITWGNEFIKGHDKKLTLQQLFTAENGIQWPDWSERISASGECVAFAGGDRVDIISGSLIGVDGSFKVLATRQPKEKEVNEEVAQGDWYDYENQKALRLPPVGERVYFDCGEIFFVVAHHCNRDDAVIGSEFKSSGELKYLPIIWCKPLDHATRKAELEKKRVVSEAANIFCNAKKDMEGLRMLYDSGYLRLPANKD